MQKERVVMISGANRGMGKAIASHLLNEGYRISIGVRKPESLSAANKKQLLTCHYDAKDFQSSQKWVTQTLETFGRIDVLHSGNYILGEEVARFEANLAKELGYQCAVGCASGTDALVLALKALDLSKGSEVITPAFSFIASVTSIKWAGFEPVMADVSLETANLTVASVEEALTERTKAVIAVDLYGRQAPIKELKEFCRSKGLYLIEDGAQSIGVPNLGADFLTTSFYPTKNLGALGDGGAVLTDDKTLAERVRELTQHGALRRDKYRHLGTNARLDAIQAAVLNIKLGYLTKWNAKRYSHVVSYLASLTPLEGRGSFYPPAEPNGAHMWSLFTLRIPHVRAGIINHLRSKGIATGIYYPEALHRQPVCKPFKNTRCPNAELLAQQVLSIPIYSELMHEEREKVIEALLECLPHRST